MGQKHPPTISVKRQNKTATLNTCVILPIWSRQTEPSCEIMGDRYEAMYWPHLLFAVHLRIGLWHDMWNFEGKPAICSFCLGQWHDRIHPPFAEISYTCASGRGWPRKRIKNMRFWREAGSLFFPSWSAAWPGLPTICRNFLHPRLWKAGLAV
jgi:hypothetical protein